MKRRRFIKLAALTTVAAAVPMVALASGKTPPIQGSEITWDELLEVQRMFQDADVPEGPLYGPVHPEAMNDMLMYGTGFQTSEGRRVPPERMLHMNGVWMES